MSSLAAIPAQAPCAQTDLGKHLLIVDDDLAVRMVARLALSKAGFQVTEASDGHTALSWLASHHFDAVLLDARMPGLDGFSTCRQMRDYLGDDALPIVMVTGQNDDESIDASFESGASDFIAKPVNWRVVTQRLGSLIRTSSLRRHLSSRSQQISSLLKTSSDALVLLDTAGTVQGTHLIDRLPKTMAQRVRVGHNFLASLDEEARRVVEAAWNAAQTSSGCEVFVLDNLHDHQRCTLHGRFVAGAEGEWLCLLQDQSELFANERRLYELAFQDPATGIANEHQLMSELRERLRQGTAADSNSLVVRYSASELRAYEPRIGRVGIARLAQTVVERLQVGVESFLTSIYGSETPERPLIARLSESDYIVVMSGLQHTDFAEEFATVLLRRLSSSIEVDGYTCAMEWIAGIADTGAAPATAEGLINATAYALEADGASVSGYRVHRYTPALKARIHQDIEVERLLRRDIAAGALEVHYQPKFSVSDLSLIGMEALIRWNSSELGFVSPASFIPIAERSGLIVSLSHLVIERVFDQLVVWRDEGRPCVPISINISGIHLNTRSIVEELRAGIQQRGLQPELVELEVTESIMVDGMGKALKNLNDLRDMGIRVAIDDFGTGYSSLSYLRELPVDCLKIDRSFVTAINTDPTAEAIARAIITVGHDVNLHVIAEGVETEAQLDRLAELGCDSVQGYLTGRPVPSNAFAPFFEGSQLAG